MLGAIDEAIDILALLGWLLITFYAVKFAWIAARDIRGAIKNTVPRKQLAEREMQWWLKDEDDLPKASTAWIEKPPYGDMWRGRRLEGNLFLNYAWSEIETEEFVAGLERILDSNQSCGPEDEDQIEDDGTISRSITMEEAQTERGTVVYDASLYGPSWSLDENQLQQLIDDDKAKFISAYAVPSHQLERSVIEHLQRERGMSLNQAHRALIAARTQQFQAEGKVTPINAAARRRGENPFNRRRRKPA